MVERLGAAWTGPVAAFRLDSVNVGRQFEGHRLVSVAGSWGEARPDSLPAGTFMIPTDQRLGMVAAFVLEPASEDGYTTWNYFDRALRPRAMHPCRRLDRLPDVPRHLVP